MLSSRTNTPRPQQTIPVTPWSMNGSKHLTVGTSLPLLWDQTGICSHTAHPMPDWHIQRNLHAGSYYPKVPVIYKRLYNFPKAFSHVTLFKLHMWVRPMWLFPFYKCVNQPQMVKSCPQLHRERVNCSAQARKNRGGPLLESGSPGTLLLPISTQHIVISPSFFKRCFSF